MGRFFLHLRFFTHASLTVLLFPLYSIAQTIGALGGDISPIISFTLTSQNGKREYCKSQARAAKDVCGDMHIYPVLSGHPDADIESKINAHIAELAPESKDDFTHIESWTEVKYNSNDYLSISHHSQSYGAGAAKDFDRLKCSNIGLKTGQIYTLENVLNPGSEAALPKIVLDALDHDLNRRVPDYLKTVLKELGDDWVVDTQQPYYVNSRELVLCYGGSIPGTNSLRNLEIPVPFSLLGNLINENGPLSFALTANTEATKGKPQTGPASESSQLNSSGPDGANSELLKYVQPKDTDKFIDERVTTEPELMIPSDGDFTYSCSKNGLVRNVSVIVNPLGARFVCRVELDRGKERSVVWRSSNSRDFCASKATGLISKYITKWDFTCKYGL